MLVYNVVNNTKSSSIIPSKTPSFEPSTKMELALLKVAIAGYFP
jgi:hypothetical protein